MKRHTTHFDDCGCLTVRYKLAINALTAIRRHMEIVGGKMAVHSTVYVIASRALDSIFDSIRDQEQHDFPAPH
jgi:hypothetical protein